MTNLDLARECGMNAIRGGGWWFETDAQLDAFAERIRAEALLDRHILQADGKHPAPCAKFCEATAFKSEIKRLEREALELAEQKTLYALLYARVREQDVLIAQMKSGAPEAPADKPERQPLTPLEINAVLNNLGIYDGDYEDAIIRATEKRHGIA